MRRGAVRMYDLTTVAPYGQGGASARVRVGGWLRHLDLDAEVLDYIGTRNNHPATVAQRPLRVLCAERRLRRLDPAPGTSLLLHREASPFSRGALEVALMRGAGRGIYDFDDALQWDHSGGLRRRMFAKPHKCLCAVRTADMVIAGNHTLADWASQWAREVVVVPSCIEPADYSVKQDYRLHQPPRLLWIGSPSTESQLRTAVPALLEVNRRTGAVVWVVSSGTAELGELSPMVKRLEWSRDTVKSAVTEADIAIGPLVDGLYEQGKCAYKLLQYGAAALPVVATPVGANRTALEALGGTAANDTAEWVAALMHWIEAADHERAAAGAAARSAVQHSYSYASWSRTWRAAVGV